MYYTLRVVCRDNNSYLVYDNPESGKWEFPGVRTQSDSSATQVKKLQEFLTKNNVVTLGIDKSYSDVSRLLTRKGERRDSKNSVLVAKELVGQPKDSAKWKVMSAAQLLKLGNLDGLTRRYLMSLKKENRTAYGIVKKASGPKDDHRSVSAILKKGKSIFIMEHPYQKIWSIPKGHIDPGETAREAIIRELDEELGIQTKDVKLVTWYMENYKSGSETPARIKHYIYEVGSYEGTPSNNERGKHGDITMKWIPVSDIQKHENMSLMSIKAAEELLKRKESKINFRTLAALPVALYLARDFVSASLPFTRKFHANRLRKDLETIDKGTPDMVDIKNALSKAEDYAGDTAISLDNTLKDGWNTLRDLKDRSGGAASSLGNTIKEGWNSIGSGN